MEGRVSDRRPVTVGIAGGIGAGKSVVSRIFRLRGHVVYDCDSKARTLIDSSDEIKASLREWCGERVTDDAGCIDRKYMAARMFADDELRGRINSLVHARVRDDFRRYAVDAATDIVFIESAIMATSGLAAMCDMIIYVTAPETVRIERAMSRDGMSAEQAMARIESQREEENALEAFSYRVVSVVNDGVSPLLPQLTGIMRSLQALID